MMPVMADMAGLEILKTRRNFAILTRSGTRKPGPVRDWTDWSTTDLAAGNAFGLADSLAGMSMNGSGPAAGYARMRLAGSGPT